MEGEEDVNQAIAACQEALQKNAHDAAALMELAEIYAVRLGQTHKAFELAKAARKSAPADTAISHALASLAYELRDYGLSLSLLQEIERREPGNPEVLHDLAVSFYSMGMVPEAAETMRSALEADPAVGGEEDGKRLLEMVALAANPSQALSAVYGVEEALKTDPNHVPALMAMAAISEQKGDIDATRQAFLKVLNLYPDFTPARKGLMILEAEEQVDNRKAYELALKAREEFPDDAEVARTLGVILFRLGNYAESVNYLKESAGQRSGDARLLFQLGMAHYRLHQWEASREALQRALELGLSIKPAIEARWALTEMASGGR